MTLNRLQPFGALLHIELHYFTLLQGLYKPSPMMDFEVNEEVFTVLAGNEAVTFWRC